MEVWHKVEREQACVLCCDGVDTAAETRTSKQSLSQAHESDSESESEQPSKPAGKKKKVTALEEETRIERLIQ